MGSHQPKVSQQTQPDLGSEEPTCTKVGGQTSDQSKPGPEGHGQLLSPSQDIQTLQDLVELAREGLTLTQWNLDTGHVQEAEQPGEFWQLCEPCPWFLQLHKARLWLGWVREPWQHPQAVGVDPRGDIVGAHIPAIRCRYNQPDTSEMIHKSQLLREFLDSRY